MRWNWIFLVPLLLCFGLRGEGRCRMSDVVNFCYEEWCCTPSYCHWYVGVEGAWSDGAGDATDSPLTAGSTFNIAGVSPQRHESGACGANLGFRLNAFRADFSYTYFSQASYEWQVPIGFTSVKAHLTSHLMLFNGYLHPLTGLTRWFDPYVTGGTGVAINQLTGIQQFRDTGAHLADISSFTQQNWAARVGVGFFSYILNSWIFDMGYSAHYIGRVISGDSRTLNTGVQQIIGAYKFQNNWINTIYFGLKYAF